MNWPRVARWKKFCGPSDHGLGISPFTWEGFFSIGSSRLSLHKIAFGMGREIRLQAFPEDWPLLKKIRAGETSGDFVQTAEHYLSWLRRKQRQTPAEAYFALETDEQYLAIYRETLELVTSQPQILWRTAYLDRRFEVLHFLLCESTDSVEMREAFAVAIYGQEQIHPNATATQGAPIKWSDVETTRGIHQVLEKVEFADAAIHFGTEKFLQEPLYKKSTDRRETTGLFSYFCEMKEYYRSAASAGNVTIAILD